MILLLESTKLHAWRACLLACFACSRARYAYVLNVLVLTCMPCLHAFVLKCLVCLRAFVFECLACLRAQRSYVLTCMMCLRACIRACYDEMFYFLPCLRTWCAFLSDLFYISILKFKNSYSKSLVCFVKLNIFLILRFDTNL